MRDVNENNYKQFTPTERTNLTFAALARGDLEDAERLWATCPRFSYSTRDFEYTYRFENLMLLSSIFFENCVLYYNSAKRAETYILLSRPDPEEYKDMDPSHLESTLRILEKVEHARDVYLERLKALFEGMRRFCAQVEVEFDDIINMKRIEKSCFCINQYLSMVTEINEEYAEQEKNGFLELWNF